MAENGQVLLNIARKVDRVVEVEKRDQQAVDEDTRKLDSGYFIVSLKNDYVQQMKGQVVWLAFDEVTRGWIV